jgi:hypothetical protein
MVRAKGEWKRIEVGMMKSALWDAEKVEKAGMAGKADGGK